MFELMDEHRVFLFICMMLQMYEKHCIQSHVTRHRKRKRCFANVPSNEPAERERKKKTETLNMTKDSWSTHSFFLRLASNKGKDKRKNKKIIHVERKNERRNYRKKNEYIYVNKKTNNSNNRTTILLVSIEIISTATVTTETHSAYGFFFLKEYTAMHTGRQ